MLVYVLLCPYHKPRSVLSSCKAITSSFVETFWPSLPASQLQLPLQRLSPHFLVPLLIQVTPDAIHCYKSPHLKKESQNIKTFFFGCFLKRNTRDHSTSINHLLNHLEWSVSPQRRHKSALSVEFPLVRRGAIIQKTMNKRKII